MRTSRSAWVEWAGRQNVRPSQRCTTCKLLISECSHDTCLLIAALHVWRCSRGKRRRGRRKEEGRGNDNERQKREGGEVGIEMREEYIPEIAWTERNVGGNGGDVGGMKVREKRGVIMREIG